MARPIESHTDFSMDIQALHRLRRRLVLLMKHDSTDSDAQTAAAEAVSTVNETITKVEALYLTGIAAVGRVKGVKQ